MSHRTKLFLAALYSAAAALFVILLASTSEASEYYSLFDLQEVRLDYTSFFPGGSDPLITANGLQDRGLGKELNLHVKTNILDYLYFNNMVHSMTDEIRDTGGRGQFRVVGWEFGLGVDIEKVLGFLPVTVGYYHFSQHLLDTTYAYDHFPVKDGIQVQIYLYRKSK